MKKYGAAVGVVLAVGLGLVASVALWPESPRPPAPKAASPADRRENAPAGSSRPTTAEAPAPREVPEAFDGAVADAFLTVVNLADGRPVPGAQVALSRVESRRQHMRMHDVMVETDANGRASFPALQLREYDLGVYCDFFKTHYGLFAAGATVSLEPIPPVHGRVLSAARAPVAGAKVSSMGRTPSTATTGADGRFSLPLPTLEWVVAEKDGAVGFSSPLEGSDVDLGAELEIVLDDGNALTARALQRNQQPLAGVNVELEIGAILLRHVTGSDGVFKVPRREGVFIDGHFSKPGYVTVRQTYMFDFGDPRNVVLSRPSQIDGVLLNAEGRPVKDAPVFISEPYEPGREHPTSHTDAEGRFAFADLDSAWVELRAIGEGSDARERIELPEGEKVPVRLVLRPQLFPVKFEVITAGGYDIREFELVATPVPPTGWTSRAHYGSLELNRGRFRFQVATEDGRAADVTMEVDPAPDMKPLLIMVHGDGGTRYDDEKPPVQLKVKVVNATGAPVVGAAVDCYGGDDVTGDDGRVECLAPANDHLWPLQVLAKKENESGMTRATGKETEVVVVIRSARTIRGRVVGQLPPADVWLEINSANGGDEVELKGNAFALENRSPIRTFVCVLHAPKGQPQSKLGCAVSEGDEELVIPVGAPGTLTFSALDDKGALMEAPVVYVDRVRQQLDPTKGLVKLAVPPGNHVMVLNQDGSRARAENRFTIQAGKVTELGVIRLQ